MAKKWFAEDIGGQIMLPLAVKKNKFGQCVDVLFVNFI